MNIIRKHNSGELQVSESHSVNQTTVVQDQHKSARVGVARGGARELTETTRLHLA